MLSCAKKKDQALLGDLRHHELSMRASCPQPPACTRSTPTSATPRTCSTPTCSTSRPPRPSATPRAATWCHTPGSTSSWRWRTTSPAWWGALAGCRHVALSSRAAGRLGTTLLHGIIERNACIIMHADCSPACSPCCEASVIIVKRDELAGSQDSSSCCDQSWEAALHRPGD